MTTSVAPSGDDTPSAASLRPALLLPSETLHLGPQEQARRRSNRAALVYSSTHLGSRLRWVRAERPLREIQDWLEKAVTYSRVNQLEHEERPNPTLATLFHLQRAYGCGSLDELLGPVPTAEWARLYRDVIERPGS